MTQENEREQTEWPKDVMALYSTFKTATDSAGILFLTAMIAKGYDAKEVMEQLAETYDEEAKQYRQWAADPENEAKGILQMGERQ